MGAPRQHVANHPKQVMHQPRPRKGRSHHANITGGCPQVCSNHSYGRTPGDTLYSRRRCGGSTAWPNLAKLRIAHKEYYTTRWQSKKSAELDSLRHIKEGHHKQLPKRHYSSIWSVVGTAACQVGNTRGSENGDLQGSSASRRWGPQRAYRWYSGATGSGGEVASERREEARLCLEAVMEVQQRTAPQSDFVWDVAWAASTFLSRAAQQTHVGGGHGRAHQRS